MTKFQMSQTKSYEEVCHSREDGNPEGKDTYLDSCLRRNDLGAKLCFEFRYLDLFRVSIFEFRI